MKVDNNVKIDNVHFTAADHAAVEGGLLGWVSCILNGSLKLDGLALRRTADGRLTLAFPSRKDGYGQKHYFLKPITDQARREVEHQVFQALGFQEDAA
jgi:DNA-binding cell septation regulator SpoVG